ncbi:hypothetical protein KDL45_10260, partial [bacterium]|nr:hypothetical protein [bacterium]
EIMGCAGPPKIEVGSQVKFINACIIGEKFKRNFRLLLRRKGDKHSLNIRNIPARRRDKTRTSA